MRKLALYTCAVARGGALERAPVKERSLWARPATSSYAHSLLPAARRFFDGCLATANDARDVDFYHWSSQSFGEVWKDALSVLMARERARIGMAASEGDLSRRIVAYAYDEQEDSAADT